jgi:hypothetical protein
MVRPGVLSFWMVALAAPAAASGIADLAWLQGCWSSVAGERTVEEHWMGPRGGTMLGVGRTVQAGRLVEHEFLVIREDRDRLVYEARPSGQAPATFAARELTTRSVVFENLQHDFPQRVGYRREDYGVLGWIEGPQNGQVRRIEFRYRRASCESR